MTYESKECLVVLLHNWLYKAAIENDQAVDSCTAVSVNKVN